MQIEELARFYETRADEELVRLAADLTQLTAVAQIALAGELAKRRINVAEHSTIPEKTGPGRVEHSETGRTMPLQPQGVGDFVAEVLRLYHSQFWLFVRLVAPAMVVGYFAIVLSQQEVRGMARHLPRGAAILRHPAELLEMWVLNLTGYFISWMAFFFSFGAICSAVQQIETGGVPSVPHSIAEVHKRGGSFARLGVLLFFLNLLMAFAAMFLFWSVVWLSSKLHFRLSGLSSLVTTFGIMGLAFLVLSRFALAVPAVILDDYRVGQAMFRSDELTEGTWLTLAALLSKAIIGGYIAGMCPFWLAAWLLGNISLPSWFPWVLTAASIAAATIVEPTMFIGFALLYRKMSAVAATANETLIH